jgi:hypothetical protein
VVDADEFFSILVAFYFRALIIEAATAVTVAESPFIL